MQRAKQNFMQRGTDRWREKEREKEKERKKEKERDSLTY